MSDTQGRPTATMVGPRALADQQARAEREAAALRENLRRRKQQARAREAEAPPVGEGGREGEAEG